MSVISRNTAFTYRSKPIDTRQIGRELGVRDVLEGSVRRSGKQLRVNAQLIDVETDTHLYRALDFRRATIPSLGTRKMARNPHTAMIGKLPEYDQMEQLGSADIFLFEGFRFDRAGGCLFRTNGSAVTEPVALGSRALTLLALLVERQGRLVTKDEIFAAVWPGIAVEEANLTVQISALRRILDRGREQGSCIQTIPGRGYRFTAAGTRFPAEAGSDGAARSQSGVGVRPRLSIVVLPFANLSDEHEQQCFADGITDDLTTDLSRLADIFVISRNTAFTYRNKPVDTRQIGRELGVRYVLEGSVRRSGNQVRVTAQLIDAATDAHLWAERYDRDMGDVFTLQNEITSRIANALGVELIAAEAARPTEHPDALDYILRGRAVLLKPRTHDTCREAINSFEHALALDPQSVEAQCRLVSVLAGRVLDLMTDSAAADLVRAEALVDQALAASPRYGLAHAAKGHVLRAQGRWEEAIPEYEAALALDHNLVGALTNLGWCKLYAGSLDEVTPLVEQAIRLSPRDPSLGYFYSLIGTVHLLQSDIDEAIVWFERVRSDIPAHAFVRSRLASAYALRGETERAASELAEARRLAGKDLFASIARLKAHPGAWLGAPKTRALVEATYFSGLRKAGVPEE
jgi:TolB-like protein/Flp pilus assembly protein TadD